MTATERLRALLDERGVEWMGTSYTKPTQGHPTNTSLDEEHHNAVFIEYVDGSVLRLFDLAPEQAVEATLGRGTCGAMKVPLEWDESWNDMFEGAGNVEVFRWVCSHCGRVLDGGSEFVERDTFCPKCGRQIEWEVES